MCDRSEDREIYPTSQKTGELLSALAGLKTLLHSGTDDFDCPCVTAKVINPYKGENLYIELAGEFTFFWGDWHRHYPPYETDFREMTEDIKRIISGGMGAVSIYREGDWLGSRSWQGHIDYDSAVTELRKDDFLFNALKNNPSDHITVRAVYWQPENSVSIDIPCREFEREGHGHFNSRK